MNEVKFIFGLLLIMTAIYVLGRNIGDIIMYVLMYCTIFLYLIGIIKRNKNNFIIAMSLMFFSIISIFMNELDYNEVEKSNNEINSISEFKNLNKDKLFIKVTADWCIYCKKMEKETFFSGSKISKTLNDFEYRTIDLTDMSDKERELLKHLEIIAPPAILIYNNGIKSTKMGYLSESEILNFINNSTGNHMLSCPECTM